MTERAPPDWAPPAQEEGFAVHFGESGAFGQGRDTLGWVGKGEVRVGPDGVRLQGKASRNGELLEQRLGFEDIRDVHCVGTRVRFDLPAGPDGAARFVRFDAKQVDTTHRILHLLPRTQTPEFARRMGELGDFRARLDACSGPPRVTPVLVAINLLVFAAMLVDGAGLFQLNGEVHLRWGSNYGPITANGQWWRLLSSAFIHFGLIHVALNMYALWDLGGVTERLYGRGRFLSLYLFAALTGSLASLWWHADPVNAAGASGAIFGLLGGLLAFVIDPRNRVPKEVMAAHRNSALLWGGYSLVYGAAHAGIDNAAHVGGLLGGFVIGLLLARPVDPVLRARPAAAQLGVAALAAALVLGAGFWAVQHPDAATAASRRYDLFRQRFATREDAAIAGMKAAFEREKAGDHAGFNAHMASAAREWQSLAAELRAIELDPASTEAGQRGLLLRYTQARQRFCELASTLPADGDASALEGADAEAQAALAELNAGKAR